MEFCQRDIFGRVIPETCLLQTICLVIDSSGMMGEYLPESVEAAVNLFFKTLGTSKDIDDLVEICVLESHDEVEFLGGFGKASSFTLADLRYGGGWSLPEALAQALYSLRDQSMALDCEGRARTTPLIVVVSDNPVSTNCSLFHPLDEAVTAYESFSRIFPRCLFVSTSEGNHFEHHLSGIEYRRANRSSLSSCFQGIAREVINDIRPQTIVDRPMRSSI